MNKTELKETLKFTKELAIEAGKILIKYSTKLDSLELKYKEGLGVASTADIKTEAFIIKQISKKFPTHFFIAEESALNGDFKKLYPDFNDENYWLIDPLDGTNNYLCGFPYYAVCISLVIKGEIKLGVVYRPENGDMFYALKEEGSYFHNIKDTKRAKKLYNKVNNKKTKESVFISEVFPKTGTSRKEGFNRYKNILDESRGVRRLGSAALDMCYVALGTFDGFWQSRLFPWDFGAASVICTESGVKVTDFHGRVFDPLQMSILVSRPPLHKKIVQLLHKEC
ncbi:MAG: myo-inositol-1(or 4)-monophosphatase [Thermoproteota archaeon]|jgi:myo-inositol-1(or 4)-monophosphatase